MNVTKKSMTSHDFPGLPTPVPLGRWAQVGSSALVHGPTEISKSAHRWTRTGHCRGCRGTGDNSPAAQVAVSHPEVVESCGFCGFCGGSLEGLSEICQKYRCLEAACVEGVKK